MEALLELLASQPLALAVFGTVLALIFGVRYLGLWQGQNADPAAKAADARVAAVIVDPTALNAAAAEVAGLTIAVTESMAVARSHTAAVDRQTDRIDKLAHGVEKLRDELIRAAAKIE